MAAQALPVALNGPGQSMLLSCANLGQRTLGDGCDARWNGETGAELAGMRFAITESMKNLLVVASLAVGGLLLVACDSDDDDKQPAANGGSNAGRGGTNDAGKGGRGGSGGSTAGSAGQTDVGGAGGGDGDACPANLLAAEGTSCDEEDKWCSDGGDDPCQFGNSLKCQGGEWVRYEAFPDPSCGEGGAGGGGGDDGCPSNVIEAEGSACEPNGKHCVYGGDSPCSFGNSLTCEGGEWVRHEAFPDPGCVPPGGGGAGGNGGAAGG